MTSQKRIEFIFNKIIHRFRREFRKNLKEEYKSLNKESISRKLAKSAYKKYTLVEAFQKFPQTRGVHLVKQNSLQTLLSIEEKKLIMEERQREPNYSFCREIFVDILSGNRAPANLESRRMVLESVLAEARTIENTENGLNGIGWILLCHVYLWTCYHLNEKVPEKDFKESCESLKDLINNSSKFYEMEFFNTLCSIGKIVSRMAGGGLKAQNDENKPNASILEQLFRKQKVPEQCPQKPARHEYEISTEEDVPLNEDLSDIDKFLEFYQHKQPFRSVLNLDWPAFRKWTYGYLNKTAGQFMIMAIDLSNPKKTISKTFSFMIDVVNNCIRDGNWVMQMFSCSLNSTDLNDDVMNFPLELYADENQVKKYIFLQGENRSSRVQFAVKHTFLIQIFGAAEVRFFPQGMSADLLRSHIEYSDPTFPDKYPEILTTNITKTEMKQRDVVYVPKSTLFCITTVELSCMVINTMEFVV